MKKEQPRTHNAGAHLQQAVDDAKQQPVTDGRAGCRFRDAKHAVQELLVHLLDKALVRQALQHRLQHDSRCGRHEVHNLRRAEAA